jgi:ABC-type phosphate/phosphonate transport system substrate-binding protein
MYLSHRPAVAALWELLRQALAAHGMERLPAALTWPQDHHAHWLSPKVLLSQTCGYPLTHALAGEVQLVGCFAYNAPQYEGIFCRSVLVARTEHAHFSLENFRGRRVAFNAPDSQSGYNALRAQVAQMARGGSFFASALQTGGHSASVAAVQLGHADLAAIDCVTYDALLRYTPDAAQGLRIVGTTEAYPGLPLVSALTTSAEELALLQHALRAVVASPAAARTLEALGIVGFETPDVGVYQRCVDMRQSAEALGYPALA